MRAILPTLLLLAACAAPEPPAAPAVPPASAAAACPQGLAPATLAGAYFGRTTRRGDREVEVVTEAAWTRFLDEHVTPAVPDGLTVLDGAGQWRGQGGTITRQRSKVLMVALPDGSPADATRRLAPVIAAYKARFNQQSVMVTTESICVGF